MNKADLISAVAAEAGLSKVDAKKAVEAFVSTVTKAIQEGDKVSLIDILNDGGIIIYSTDTM